MKNKMKLMQITAFQLLFCSSGFANPPGEEARNYYKVRVHPTAHVYFHGHLKNMSSGEVRNSGTVYLYGNLTNEGSYENTNNSLDRFLGDEMQTIDGQIFVQMFDAELDNTKHLNIQNILQIQHQFKFTNGHVLTDKTKYKEQIHFLQGAVYTGESDSRHVNGFVGKKGNEPFSFPIGDGNAIHRLDISAPANTFDILNAGYFNANPLNNNQLSGQLKKVSEKEYWELKGVPSVQVTLHWLPNSDIPTLSSDISKLRIVGYDGTKWVDLGNASTTGNTISGTITSASKFVPSFYQKITIGSVESDLVRVTAKVFLQGAYNPTSQLMNDTLRVKSYIPLKQPYNSIGNFNYNGNETTTAAVLAQTGNDAVVDWVLVDVRDALDAKKIIATQAGLLQRNGRIVGIDGVSPLIFTLRTDQYYVSVRHRNHLGVMTLVAQNLTATPTVIDFTISTTANYGTYAQRQTSDNKFALWAGNANLDDKIIYVGTGTDYSPISAKVLTAAPNAGTFSKSYVVDGYHVEDVDMNGKVIYVGTGTDQTLISQNVLLHPENISFSKSKPIIEQIPK